MPRGVKRRKADTDCYGEGCGQPGCSSCWLDADDLGFLDGPGILDAYQPSQRARVAAMQEGNSPVQPRGQSSFASLASAMLSSPLPATARVPAPVPKTDSTAAQPRARGPSVRDMVAELDAQTLRDLIVDLAARSKLVAPRVQEAYQARQSRPSATAAAPSSSSSSPAAIRTPGGTRLQHAAIPLSRMRPALDLDFYSKTVWHAINAQDLTWVGNKSQREHVRDVCEEIRECLATIETAVRAQGSALGTRRSAVETVRKIAKTLLLSEGTVGDEVRKELLLREDSGDGNSSIVSITVGAVVSMTSAERIALGKREDEKGMLVEKMKWVKVEADKAGLEGLRGLGDAIEMMETGRVVVSLD